MSELNYQLIEVMIPPGDLLLDPNNPRLQERAGAPINYSDKTIAAEKTQDQLLATLVNGEHEVTRLAESMRENGYVNIDSIVVKRLDSIDKYLVIEGNRRTAAIKTLLADSSDLKAVVKESVKKIPVKELVCSDNEFAERMEEFILSIRHIYGVKEWAPMQRAHSIYKAYMHRFRRDTGLKSFRYIAEIGKSVGTTMNIKPPDVKKAISIYNVFMKMQGKGYRIRSDHYSLLEMAIVRPKMAEEVFGFEGKGCSFSSEGMELFDALIVEHNCPIRNPKDFRGLYKAWKHGGRRVVEEVADRANSIGDVVSRLTNQALEKDAEGKLDRAKTLLEKISIDQIQGSRKEAELAQQIMKIIDEKLLPAINS